MDKVSFGGRQPPKTENPVGQRILSALAAVNHGVPWLAKQTKLSPTTIHDQIKNGIAKVDNALGIAETLGVTVSWLLTGADQAVAHVPRDTVAVPVFDVEVSTGPGRTIADRIGDPLFYWKFPKEWAEANLRNIGSLRMFYVVGDSQEPELSKDDLVAVDTSDVRLNTGLYVVRLDDQLMAKRIQKAGDEIMLLSRNPIYETEIVHRVNDADRFDVVGRVVWASKML